MQNFRQWLEAAAKLDKLEALAGLPHNIGQSMGVSPASR